MLRGFFVTGTGTGVGKTVVVRRARLRICAAALPSAIGSRYKPAIEQDDDTAEVARLAECSEAEILCGGIRLERPVSPHLAARLAGRRIDVAEAIAPVAAPDDRVHIVEGAGGVLVPLNESETMADLMRALGLPAVVVAAAALGTINHTLLTLEALRTRGIPVAGVLMSGADSENRAAIEHYRQSQSARRDAALRSDNADPLAPGPPRPKRISELPR